MHPLQPARPHASGTSLKVLARDVPTAEIYRDLEASPHVAPSGAFRLYVCPCTYHVESHEQSIASADEEWIEWKHNWTCGGHPAVTLPHRFDGVEVGADDLDALVLRGLSGAAPARDPSAWLARLATRLDGTPHQARVVAAAAAHLTAPDEPTRVRAVYFFASAPRFAAAMQADVLLGRHPDLFFGVPDPWPSGAERSSLADLIFRLCSEQLPANAALRDVARAAALDPARSSRQLFQALSWRDEEWFAAHADAIVQRNPDRVDVLRRVLDDHELSPAIRAAFAGFKRREALVDLLLELRALVVKPTNDFTWSSWIDGDQAAQELDRGVARLRAGEAPGFLSVLFLPTGPAQELAISSGWGDTFIRLADRFDALAAEPA
ncbi:MAG: hypothetical protein U1E73_13780 [Planctomycetota bacterium]